MLFRAHHKFIEYVPQKIFGSGTKEKFVDGVVVSLAMPDAFVTIPLA